MVKVRVLVADEQTLFRQGVCALLELREDLELVGEATNGTDTIRKVREQAPDVVLVNLAMHSMNGSEVTHRIHEVNSNVKVLLLTQYEDKDHVLDGLRAGASGCIPKRATISDLVSAIQTVHQGDCFLYPSVAKTMMEDYIKRIKQSISSDPYDRLTHREREMLKLMAEGRKSGEIANLLRIACKTVQGHRANLMRKLGIRNQTDLVKYALRRGVIDLET